MLQSFYKVTGMISSLLNMFWKYTEFRSVYLCHKKLDMQMLFLSRKLFHSKVSILFFLKQESLITQLPIILRIIYAKSFLYILM